MSAEIVYNSHDNTIDLQLMSDGSPATLTPVTKITATFGTALVQSANAGTATIRWSQAGYDEGEIRMALGHLTLAPRTYSVPIVVYSASWASGVVWDTIAVTVTREVEATP